MIDEKVIRIYRVKTNSRGERTETVTVCIMPKDSSKLKIVEVIEEDAKKLDIPVKLHINILLGVRGESATQKKFNWLKSRFTWYTEETYKNGIPF